MTDRMGVLSPSPSTENELTPLKRAEVLGARVLGVFGGKSDRYAGAKFRKN